MNEAFAWLGQVVEWIGRFVPRWEVLDLTQGAVKFVGGKKAVPLGPGIHWYWPVMTKLFIYPTARQADDLRSQTMVTTDDKVIVVGGMIVYEVEDIEKLLAHTYHASQAVKDLSLTVIHDVCCQMSWEELKQGQRKGTLDTRLRNAAKEALEPYGVRVIKAMLTDLAPAEVIKILQSTSRDEDATS